MTIANKPGSCFKEAQQCRRSNYLYAVVTLGYTNHNAEVEGSIPSPN